MSDENPNEVMMARLIDAGRRNVKLMAHNNNLKFSRWNYMALAAVGWGLFIASQAGWLPQ